MKHIYINKILFAVRNWLCCGKSWTSPQDTHLLHNPYTWITFLFQLTFQQILHLLLCLAFLSEGWIFLTKCLAALLAFLIVFQDEILKIYYVLHIILFLSEIWKPDGLLSSCSGFLCKAQKHYVLKYLAVSWTVLCTTVLIFQFHMLAVFHPSNLCLP